jgi:hypothetical protein
MDFWQRCCRQCSWLPGSSGEQTHIRTSIIDWLAPSSKSQAQLAWLDRIQAGSPRLRLGWARKWLLLRARMDHSGRAVRTVTLSYVSRLIFSTLGPCRRERVCYAFSLLSRAKRSARSLAVSTRVACSFNW